MRRSIAAFMVAAGLAGAGTPAVAAKVIFSGVMAIESASTACGILPYVEQGNLLRAVFKPAGVGTNGASTALLLQYSDLVSGFTDLLVSGFMIERGTLDTSFRNANATQVTPTNSLSLNFETYVAQMRRLEQFPATIVSSTKFVTMRLQIRNFGKVAQCIVTFRGIISDKATPKL